MHARKLSVLLVGAICAAALALPGGASAAFVPLGSFAGFGEGNGQFEDSGGLAVGPDGRIYQADFGANRVNVYSAQGTFLFMFGAGVYELGGNVCTADVQCRAGFASAGAGGLDSPEDVAIDELGHILVADTDNNRIGIYEPDGKFLAAFGKDVNTTDGSDICTVSSGCVKGAATAENGALATPRGVATEDLFTYVADTGNNRISAYNVGGGFLGAFGKNVSTAGGNVCPGMGSCQAGAGGPAAGEISEPRDLVLMPGLTGIAIASAGNHRIDVFGSEANFVRALGAGVNPNGSGVCTTASGCQEGSNGEAAGALAGPVHLAYDNAGGVYAGDVELDRVSQFNLETGFVRSFGAGVVNGSAAFQVCTAATGCRAGLDSTIPGATPNPYGVAVESGGTVLVAEEGDGMGNTFARIERFGFVPDPPAPPVPPAPPAPSNQFKFGQLKLNKKAGTATLTITLPGAGSAVLKGNGVKKVKKAAKKAGKLSLPVKLKGKAKEKLLEKGRASVSAKLTFTPTGGKALTKQKRLTLKKTLP